MCHWIGDTFWALQVIPELKKKYPGAEIWAGVKPWSKDLLYGLIDEDKIIVLRNVISDRHRETFSFKQSFDELKKVRSAGFDLAFDLMLNRYSAIFLRLSGIKERIGLNEHKLSFFYTKKGPKFDAKQHFSKRPWDVVRVMFPGTEYSSSLIPVNSSPINREKLKNEFVNHNPKIALLSPGAGYPGKSWALDNFAESGKFLEDSGYKVIISGSEKEKELCDLLAKQLKNPVIFIRPLKEFIAFFPFIDIAITNDSGPAHLLAAAGRKLITIHLITDKNQYGSLGSAVTVIEKENATVSNVIAQIKKYMEISDNLRV